ncbi:Mobile element protein [Candidatus Enterovibrio altilux]|uniref:Mobile element protein n=1 Tax=Candidatus Enterovibrio altilux TaxID=1927128 RepID=A0A291B6U9_9GAMM|nr:Mobile element protein [Candidatus Enterovibrio luxaltus]
MLKQTLRKINEISTNGDYDTKQYYETVPIKRAIPSISPRKGATFWE